MDASDHITGDVFDIVKCDSCGVQFTSPVPVNLDRYYPPEYRQYGPVVRNLLRIFYKFRVSRWAQSESGPGSALEIGCGAGFMLDALRRKGWDVTGLERTEEAAQYARQELGLNVISGGIEQIPNEASYDLIILFNVLEHVTDPLDTLKTCAGKLKPNGRLMISLPNIDSWQARFGGPVWLHLDPPRHLTFFSPQTLKQSLDRVGLKSENISFVSYEHDPYGWLESIINKITGKYNHLTRYLMGLEKFNRHVGISFFLILVFGLPSVCLAIASWVMNKGSIFEATVVHKS